MTKPDVLVEIDDRTGGRVATVTIANPARLNALSSDLVARLRDRLAELGGDESLRVVVLQGSGDRAFVGGADINELARLNRASAREFITGIHLACEAIRELPVPVIAKIRGYCLGAGLEIAASCDLRVATEQSQFGMPEVQLGVPSVIEAALLPQLIGWGRTRELVFAGRSFTATEVTAWGLIERVVASDRLESSVEEWVGSILRAGPAAIRLQKSLIREWERLPLEQAIEAGIDAFERAYDTDEPVLRTKRFLRRGDDE